MTIDALIMLLGAIVAVLPFLGFPENWDTVFFFLAGVFIIALGIVVRRRLPQQKNTLTSSGMKSGKAFVESAPARPDMPAPAELGGEARSAAPPHEETLGL